MLGWRELVCCGVGHGQPPAAAPEGAETIENDL
jgi:hypothetical protein